jgi:hypothetical protein
MESTLVEKGCKRAQLGSKMKLRRSRKSRVETKGRTERRAVR